MYLPCRSLCLGFLVLMLCLSGAPAASQQPESSHQERFASAQERLRAQETRADKRLRENPRDGKALAERGLARLRLGETAAGIADFRRVVALRPSSADAQADLAYALWTTGKRQEALVAGRTAVRLNPNHAAAHYYLARLLVETGGDPDEALKHFQRAADLNPLEIGYRYDLFNAYLQHDDLPHAGAQLRLLRVTLPPDNPQLLYAQGLYQANVGSLALAVTSFRAAVEKNPRLNPARLDLGLALCKLEKWQEAEPVLANLARDLPESYPAAYFHALTLQNLHRAVEAEAEARRALTLEPQAPDANTLLGILLSQKQQFGAAVEALEAAARAAPGSFDAQFYLGRAHYSLRNLAAARDAFRAAARLRPEDLEARFFLATALEGLGETEAALGEYRALTGSHPQDPRGFVGLGNLLAKNGQLDDAEVALSHARQLAPQDFESALDLGRVLLRKGKFAEAIEVLSAAVERAPKSADAHYQLAQALRRAAREQEAAAEFAIVDRLNREYRSGQSGMGQPPPENKRP